MNFSSLFLSLGLLSRQKVNKASSRLHCTTNQMELIGIYRTFNLMFSECKFFSPMCGYFSHTDCVSASKIILIQSIQVLLERKKKRKILL